MNNSTKSLVELVKELPPEYQEEVKDFAKFLLETKITNKSKKQEKLKLTWAGALSEFRDQYTSLELQKKSLEWWGD